MKAPAGLPERIRSMEGLDEAAARKILVIHLAIYSEGSRPCLQGVSSQQIVSGQRHHARLGFAPAVVNPCRSCDGALRLPKRRWRDLGNRRKPQARCSKHQSASASNPADLGRRMPSPNIHRTRPKYRTKALSSVAMTHWLIK